MTTKSTFLAWRARASRTLVPGSPHWPSLALSVVVHGGNLSLTSRASGGCRFNSYRDIFLAVSLQWSGLA